MIVATAHIQELLKESLELAALVHHKEGMEPVDARNWFGRSHLPFTQDALERAVNLARHAAAELEDELMRTKGWQ